MGKTKNTDTAKEPEVKDTDTSRDIEEKTPKAKDTGISSAKEKTSKHEQKCVTLALKYFKSYKGEKVLHITSDYQVFLSHNKGLALLHQRTIPGEVLVTVSADGKIIR